jgi:hypothetical protein
VLHSSELPTAKQVVDVISRLNKDYSILHRFRGSKDIEDPQSMHAVILFLENFLKKGKRRLSKEPNEIKDMFKVSAEMMIELRHEHPELVEEMMEEINFTERLINGPEGSDN